VSPVRYELGSYIPEDGVPYRIPYCFLRRLFRRSGGATGLRGGELHIAGLRYTY
jgi:hypothetical protein